MIFEQELPFFWYFDRSSLNHFLSSMYHSSIESEENGAIMVCKPYVTEKDQAENQTIEVKTLLDN